MSGKGVWGGELVLWGGGGRAGMGHKGGPSGEYWGSKWGSGLQKLGIQLLQLDSVTPEEPLAEQRKMAAAGHAPGPPSGS